MKNTANPQRRNNPGGAAGAKKRAPEVRSLGPRGNRKLLGLVLVAVMALVAAVHRPALTAQATTFDDDQYLLGNVRVQNASWENAGIFLKEIRRPSTVRGYYQPLAMISLMLDSGRGGSPANLRPYHQSSLALHVLNTGLVIVLLYLLFRQELLAGLVGLLFGLHPLTVEPIPWVGERKTLLAAFFFFLCLIFYVRYAQGISASNPKSKIQNPKSSSILWLFTSSIFFMISLLAKPTGTPLPALLLLLDFWPLQRRFSKKLLWEKVPFLVVAGISAYITWVSQRDTSSLSNPPDKFLTLCHDIVFYLYKILLPINLSNHYPVPEPFTPAHPMVLAGLIGVPLLLGLLLLSLKRTQAFFAGGLFFFVAIFPALGVIGRFNNVIATDKFTYLPSLGLLMIMAWGMGRAWNFQGRPIPLRPALCLLVALLAGLETWGTRFYYQFWQDTHSLHTRMLELAPKAAFLHFTLGKQMQDAGELDQAQELYEKALELQPGLLLARGNLGIIYKMKGDTRRAQQCFEEMARFTPDDYILMFNLGDLAEKRGALPQAQGYYEKGVQLRPFQPELQFALGKCLYKQAKYAEGLKHLREAVRLNSLPKRGWYLNEAAWCLATCPEEKLRNPAQAVNFAQLATQDLPGDPAIRYTLAAAYAANGQFPEAVSTAEQALNLARTAAPDLVPILRAALDRYHAGKKIE